MRTLRPGSVRPGLTLLVLAALAATTAGAGEVTSNALTVLGRSIIQDQGDWQVDYRLRHDGGTVLVSTPGAVCARVEGWVSNSRAASHALPRWSSLVISGRSGCQASTDVIASIDEDQRCRERAVLWVGTADGEDGPSSPSASAPAAAKPIPNLQLTPGATFRVRLRLEHRHAVYGSYDPLLGPRTLELSLGAATLRDTLPLDRELHVAQARSAWTDPPVDRRDPRHFVSAPDSLHLEAHIPGNESYRYPDQPVRYETRMRLRYWYLIAPGTEGECFARITQFKDSPSSWRDLPRGSSEAHLATAGRWTRVEQLFRTEPDATTLTLDFRIDGADVGELWIDDVALEPVGSEPDDP